MGAYATGRASPASPHGASGLFFGGLTRLISYQCEGLRPANTMDADTCIAYADAMRAQADKWTLKRVKKLANQLRAPA